MILTTLILFVLIILLLHLYYHHQKFEKHLNLLPGVRSLPLVGCTYHFLLPPEELWKKLRQVNNEYYPLHRLWNFRAPIVSLRHPDDIETILSNMKNIEKSPVYNLLHPWFGTGLLTSGGSKWQTRRKILTPAFHFNILLQFVEILMEEGNRMTKTLETVGGPVIMDLLPFVTEHTLNVICESAMGTTLQDRGSFEQRYRKAVHDIGQVIIYRLIRPWWNNHTIFSFSSKGREQTKNLKILHGFTNKIIEERKHYHELTNGQYLKIFMNQDSNGIQNTEVLTVPKKRLAMLDLLIAALRDNKITHEDIREEVDTFMFEGHDTTAMAIFFTLLLLAEHKDIQEEVRKEVDMVLQENGNKLTMTALQNLSYLERCLKESLRLYPSVPFIARTLSQDVILSSYHIPAGTDVHIHIYDVHRDPNFWPNPNVFDPDRFLPERSQNRHYYSYIPFSAGPRNCIGQRFAMLELKTMVASLIHNFYLEPIDYLKDIRLVPDLVIRPSHPVRIKFIPIK